MRNLQGVKVRQSQICSQLPYYVVRYIFGCVVEELVLTFCWFVNVQDAQQQRLCTQEASILQMKQELLRASMTKDDLNNQNV